MPSIPRSALVPYTIAAVLVLVLGGRWLARRPAAEPVEAVRSAASGPAASQRPATLGLSHPDQGAVVHVAGAVRRPGVYRLRPGSRVRDAVRRAGGSAPDANTAGVNLAATLADGQQIIVPERAPDVPGRAAAAVSADAGTSGPLSLNAATLEQLDSLQGVGPATAQKILDRRTQRGGFASVDDLGEIPGIGPKRLEALRPQVSP